jgi:spore germination protein KB
MILTGLSLWVYDSAPEMLAWAIEVWPYYSLPFQIFIPLLLLILSFIKGKKMA